MAKLSKSAQLHRMLRSSPSTEKQIIGPFFALNTDPSDADGVINCVSGDHAVRAAIAANKKCNCRTRWTPCYMTQKVFIMMDILPKDIRNRINYD